MLLRWAACRVACNEKNTPTMGGLIIYISLMVSVLLWARPNVYVLTALLVYSVLTAVGFIDDYLKVVHRNSKGLSSRWKLLTQAILTLAVVFLLLWDADVQYHMSQLWVPFYKVAIVHEMPLWFAIIFFFLVMAGSSNAINLTDGVDGWRLVARSVLRLLLWSCRIVLGITSFLTIF